MVRYLMQNRSEFMAEFQAIAEMTSTLPSRGCMTIKVDGDPDP